MIVIGGILSQAGEHLLAGIREVVYQRSLPLATQHLRIAQSRTGQRAGVLGATPMVIEHAFDPVQLPEFLESMTDPRDPAGGGARPVSAAPASAR